jgi:hypothetical protein
MIALDDALKSYKFNGVHLKRWKVKGMVWFIALEIHQVIDGRPK